MKKYFLVTVADFEGNPNDGWLYTKTENGPYRLLALMMSDFEHSFDTRRRLLKFHGVDCVHESYDSEEYPYGAAPISEAKAKRIIKAWKKRNKELWP